MSKGSVIYTCGHSDRSAEAFIALLAQASVKILIDVRAHPVSRRHPQFERAALSGALAAAGIEYIWLGRELGGRRRTALQSPHIGLAAEGFRGYADHMGAALFQDGMQRLRALAKDARVAVMCAERRPEHCHRSFIADWLVLQGDEVVHLIEPGVRAAHGLSPLARIENGRLIYDRNVTASLGLD